MRMLTIFIALALAAPQRLAAQPEAPPKKEQVIAVIGVGTVKYKPESAKIAFAVKASDNAVATALKDNQTQVDKLQAALEALKVSGLQIKIAPPDVSQNMLGNLAVMVQPMAALQPGVTPFNVTRTFQVFVGDKDFAELHKKVLKIMETALTHGANAPATSPGRSPNPLSAVYGQTGSITRVDFFSRNDGDPRQQAYRRAVEAALNNARAAAEGGQLKLGNIMSISELQDTAGGSGEVDLMQLSVGQPAGSASSQDVNGEMEVTVRVRVTFKF